MDRVINLLALVTLVEMMIFIGLSASVADFVKTLKDPWLVAKGAIANYILVPAVTVGLLLLFRPNPWVAVGFLVLAVCPAGPYGAPYTGIARGNVGAAAGLMVILAAMSPIFSPLLLNLTAPMVSQSQSVHVNLAQLVVTLLLGQAAPLAAGLAVHQYCPRITAKLVRPAAQLSKVLNVALLALLLYSHFQALLQIKLLGFVGMGLLLGASLAIGWVAGGHGTEGRKAMALTTAVRNNGVAMVIATASFTGTPAVTATVVYGVVALLGALVAAVIWGKRGSNTTHGSPPGPGSMVDPHEGGRTTSLPGNPAGKETS